MLSFIQKFAIALSIAFIVRTFTTELFDEVLELGSYLTLAVIAENLQNNALTAGLAINIIIFQPLRFYS